jgi:hypothetical protein
MTFAEKPAARFLAHVARRESLGVVDPFSFGCVFSAPDDPEPTQAVAVANAAAWQAVIDASASTGRAILPPPGVLWVAGWHQRKTGSVLVGSDQAGGFVIKMHGSVHRDMPLSVSSLRDDPQFNIRWSNVTFDFNRARWSRGRNETNNGVADNTSQADLYGPENIIPFTSEQREAVFGADTGALTGSAFIASDVNPLGSGKRSTYRNIRCIDAYKHSLDVTAPSYARGRGRLLGPRYYDPQPACGIDLHDCYAVGAGDDCITTHHCYDINFNNAFGDVPSGVRTGNSNSIEVDDGSRLVRFYGRTVAIGGTSGLEVKGHSDSPAPHDIYLEHLVTINCITNEVRHLGHHSGTAIVTYTVTAVDQEAGTFTIGTNVLEEPLGDAIQPGDFFTIIGSTGNNGTYLAQEVTLDEETGVTIVAIVTDPEDEELIYANPDYDPEDPESPEFLTALSAIASATADGTVPQPEALTSPTARRVTIDRMTVIAPRRLTHVDEPYKVVYRRDGTRRAFAIKAYSGVEIGTFEAYDGTDIADDLVNTLPQWLPTDMVTSQSLIRPYLRSSNVSIGNLIIRGFPQVRYGLYTTGSFRNSLRIGFIDSVNGPINVLRATGAVSDVTVGGYRIRRDTEAHGLGTYGIRLSSAATGKSIGPGTVTGYSLPIAWNGKSWQNPPVAFAQDLASPRLRAHRKMVSSGNNPTIPQDFVVLTAYEGSQDLGSGEGINVTYQFQLANDADPVDIAYIGTRKISSSDSTRTSVFRIAVSADGIETPRDVLIANAGSGIIDMPFGARSQGEDVLTGAATVAGSVLMAPVLRQTNVADLQFGVGETQIFEDADYIPNGMAWARVGGTEKLYILQRLRTPGYSRIVEFNLGSNTHVAFSEPLEFAGQDLSAVVTGSSVTLYTASSEKTGIAAIAWRGALTDQTDVTEIELIGQTGHRFERFNSATVGVGAGRLVLMANVTRTETDETGHNLIVYDLAEVLAAGDPLDVLPIFGPTPVKIGVNRGQQVLQGVAPGRDVIAIQRGYVNPYERNRIDLIDYNGNLLRSVEYAGSLNDHALAELGDHPTLGHLNAVEPEGCAFDDAGRLLVLTREEWQASDGDVVSFEGQNFHPRRGDVTADDSPADGNKWVKVDLAADGAWAPAAYDWGSGYTRRAKVVHRIAPALPAGGDDPLSSSAWLDSDLSTLQAGNNATKVSYPWGDLLSVGAWMPNVGKYRRAFQYFTNALRLFDTRHGADNSKRATIFADMAGDREILALRARSDLSTGAGINLYGREDSLFPGWLRIWGTKTDGSSVEALSFDPNAERWRAFKLPQVIYSTGARVAVTGTTSATVLRSVTIPGGVMGPNGRLEVKMLTGQTNNSNSKTLRVRLGGVQIMNTAAAVTSTASHERVLAVTNRNDTGAQIAGPATGANMPGTSTVAVAAYTLDTTADLLLEIEGQLTNTADELALESLAVEVTYAP